MKRLISILVITAMLLASVMAMIPAFADELDDGATETPKAPIEYTYNVNWKALHEANKMQANWDNKPRGLGANSEFLELYTVNATENSLVVDLKTDYDTTKYDEGWEQRTYFSTEMFALSETTYFEYVLSGKNNRPSGFGGFVFAYDTNNYPYILAGAIDNSQNSLNDGVSELRMRKGVFDAKVSGTEDYETELDVDAEQCGTVKIVFEGYKVSVYGLVDAENGTYEKAASLSFTLPEGSKIAPGVFSRNAENSSKERTVTIKNAVITAKNRESAAILAGASEAKIALAAALDAAYGISIFTDYTDASVEVFNTAIANAEAIFTDATKTDEDFVAAKEAIETALVAKKANLTFLVMYYSMLKYRDNAMYNQDEVAALLAEAEAAMENKSILQSEVDALVGKMGMISELAPIYSAADFANMDPNGNYILMEDIEITASYGEFKGYLNGNGKTITVKDCGVFGTLNGATVFDFTIDGSITGTSHVGALATNAKGNIAITNVINNATINVNKGGQNVGGFIGQGKGTNITFTNCVNNADIIGGRTSGFYATTVSGEINLYFYNCINKGNISCGESVSTNPAAGFVARTASDGTTKNIVFEYCANYGDINSKYSAGAFFGCGKATDIKLYGCVVTDTTVTAADNQGHMRPVGGVIGGSTSDDGVVNVEIDSCYFSVNVEVTKNKKNNPVAAIVGGATGSVSIKNVIVTGSVTTVDEYAYRLTSVAADRLTVENVLVDVELNIPEIPDTSKDPISGTGEGETPVYPNKEPADTTPNTDMEAFDEDSTVIAAKGIIAMQAAAMEMNAENKIEATEEYVAALEGLVTKLELAQAEALAKLGDKIAADGYTVDSYTAYEAKYAEIVAAINAATTVEEVEAIDLTAAEALLVTQAAADAAALQAAKDAKLAELGDKIAADGYTVDSYAAYKAKYEEIVASINNAADLAAVEAIVIADAKTAAEDLLLTPDEAAALALQAAKDAKLAEIEAAKKSATVYTADSYELYIAEVDAFIASVNNEDDVAKVEAIDVAAGMTEAEKKLVELSAEEALAALKAEALAKVEAAKKAADIYTAESYTLYIADVNALIDSINGAADRAAIEAIDVAAAMTAAEANLEEADLVAALEAAKKELVTSIPTVDYAPYTGASYREYLVAIDALKDRIEAAADMAELEAIDVDAGIAAAKAKLVTLEAQAEADAAAKAEAEAAAKAEAEAAAKKAFDDAKATYLIALSAKRENAGKVFTDASYTEYSAAFDAIKAQIEGAADIAALQAIDVAALKVAAENKLAVNVPAAPEAPDADNKDDDNKNDETDKATEENKDDETEAPKDDKGCGSTPIIIIAIVVVVCGGVALFVMQKKKEN